MVEKFVHENVSGFSGNQVAVEISSGPTYRPISLFINEFQPVDEDFLALSQIKTDEDGNLSSEFTRQYAPPFALPPSSSIALREKCLEHVELIAKGSRNDGELSKKHTSIISWDLFNAIAQYQKSVNVGTPGSIIPETKLNYHGTEQTCRRSYRALCYALFHGPKSCFHGRFCRCGDHLPHSPDKAAIQANPDFETDNFTN